MNSPQPDYYEMFGLSPASTPDDIKKRYRELARRYHPDVNPSPEAAHKIKRINEAYHILGDPERRTVYDAERALRQKTAEAAKPRPAAAKPSAPANGRTAHPPYPNERAEFNGFGRTAPESSYSPSRPAGGSAAPSATNRRPITEPRPTGTFGKAERLTTEAQLAFINRRYGEAEELCRQALSIDRKSAVAHEILGDIWRKRGQWQHATAAYSYAVQFNPRNVSAQVKLERLLDRQDGVKRPGPTINASYLGADRPHMPDGTEQEASLFALNVLLTLFLVGIPTALALGAGDPSFLIGALTVEGVLAGILLAFNGGMRPISEELLTRERRADDRPVPISLGALLTLFALVCFYVSLLVYIGTSAARNRISPSVLRVYGVTALLIAVFTGLCVYNKSLSDQVNSLLVAAFAGNILFPTALFGWAVGDAVRLRGRL